MYADTAKKLRNLLKAHPDASPSQFLRDDSFASVCFDDRSISELTSDFNGDANPDECRRWNLSATEWKEQIEMALVAKKARY